MVFDKSVICPVVIGRENDLQLLDRLIQQLKAEGGQIALISGEAGIGKSRLVKEANTRAPADALILEGNCFQTESALPYAPFLDLFRNLFAARSNQELTRALVSVAPQLVQLFPELAVCLPHLPSTPALIPNRRNNAFSRPWRGPL